MCTNNENYDTVSNKLMHTQYNKNENNLILPSDKFIHICINDAYNRFPNKYILLDNLYQSTRRLNANQMRKYMGFPVNWEEIKSCKLR